MAKNFRRAASFEKFSEIARVSVEKANVVTLKIVTNECLIDYPGNFEDITDTADLENSIRELGFTDPLEVTPCDTDDGRYMIVSGHRRRAAGVKTGMDIFPCIVKSFPDEASIKNYVLLSNSCRDSSKDPLIYCRRYKMHEEYLREIGFDGSIREEIARRLGISVQQADRYKQFNKIISPVWDMVRDGIVGISSVIQMASHSVEEQRSILEMLYERADNGDALTREVCDDIIKSYREVLQSNQITPEQKQSHACSGNERKIKRGRIFKRQLDKLVKTLDDGCVFEDGEAAEESMRKMKDAFETMVAGMYTIGKDYGRDKLFQELLSEIHEIVSVYGDG